MKKVPRLRLISFDPEEIPSGEMLLKSTGERIEDPIEIGAVFSLVFMWPTESRTFLQRGMRQERALEIEFITPQMMSEIDFLHFKLRDPRPETFLRAGDSVIFYVEIFQTSYRFETAVFEVKKFGSAQPVFAVTPPNFLLVQKLRRLPRIMIPESENVGGKIGGLSVKIIEMGADSFVAREESSAHSFEKGSELKYEFQGFSGMAQFLRKSGHSMVFQLKEEFTESIREASGSFFSFYRKIRYPQFEEHSLGLEFVGMEGEKELWYSFWPNESPDHAQYVLLQVEALLRRRKEIELFTVYPTSDAFGSRLWNKFCQESRPHRVDYPKHVSTAEFLAVREKFPEKIQLGSQLESQLESDLRFVRLNQKDLLHLYSSVQHLCAVNDEMRRKRKAG